MILPAVFKNYPELNLHDTVDNLNKLINSYFKAIGLYFDFWHMTWDEQHKVGMKKDSPLLLMLTFML